MKKFLSACALLLAGVAAQAQSKVFKQVSDDISTEIRAITQDNSLVGYIVFSQLEKASADSFNYKLTIMDENLNDIGAVNFREENVWLQSVSFEQDVLCVSYLKNNIVLKSIKGNRKFKQETGASQTYALFQFLNLQGKIFKTQKFKVTADYSQDWTNKIVASIKTDIQLKNIPQQGFLVYYADQTGKKLMAYNLDGEQRWSKDVKGSGRYVSMLTAGTDAYILSRDVEMAYAGPEGGYQVHAFNAMDGVNQPVFDIKDKDGVPSKVLSFQLDPSTGRPYISGEIINPRKGGQFDYANGISKGAYLGVYTINFNALGKKGIVEKATYWSDGSQENFSKSGYYKNEKQYARLSSSFKDAEGNTYFAGSGFVKRTKYVSIGMAVLTAPTVLFPVVILAAGTRKAKMTDGMLLKQDKNGKLSIAANIDGEGTRFRPNRLPLSMMDNKAFFSVYEPNSKSSHVIMEDTKNFTIYNVTQHKVSRTISKKEGGIRTAIMPAKEGHIMVAEYNKSEKSTRVSIEAI